MQCLDPSAAGRLGRQEEVSNSLIFVWALAVYALSVFVAVLALLRTRRENGRLQQRVLDLEEKLRSRPTGQPDEATREERAFRNDSYIRDIEQSDE